MLINIKIWMFFKLRVPGILPLQSAGALALLGIARPDRGGGNAKASSATPLKNDAALGVVDVVAFAALSHAARMWAVMFTAKVVAA
jgi:hypothetical protein